MRKIIIFTAPFVFTLFLSMIFLTACSTFEHDSSGSVRFKIDRAITAEEKENLYIDISLKGGYSESKTISLKESTSVNFDGIPIGTELYAEAVAYQLSDDKESRTICYSGKSESITIQAGENPIQIKLKSSGTVLITVTIITEVNDISLSYKAEESGYIFTANSDASSEYLWYVDGILQSEKSSSFKFTTEDLIEGVYEIEVVSGIKSASASLKIN